MFYQFWTYNNLNPNNISFVLSNPMNWEYITPTKSPFQDLIVRVMEWASQLKVILSFSSYLQNELAHALIHTCDVIMWRIHNQMENKIFLKRKAKLTTEKGISIELW